MASVSEKRERSRIYRKKWMSKKIAAGLCTSCGQEPAAPNRRLCPKCLATASRYQRARNEVTRLSKEE